jgi:hypothetical protein
MVGKSEERDNKAIINVFTLSIARNVGKFKW